MNIKWYMWAILVWLPTKSSRDISVKQGIELTTIMYYKEFRDSIYIVKTTYTTRPAIGSAHRRTRRNT